MALPLPPPTSYASHRSLVSAPDDLGYVYFHREQTAAKLRDYLLINDTQFDAIIADVDRILQLPSNAALVRPHTRIRGKVCTDVRQIALDIQQQHANNCGFPSHPDLRLVQCSLWDIVKKRITVAKNTPAVNHSRQISTSTSPVQEGETSDGKAAPCLGQKHKLELSLTAEAKKLRSLIPASMPAPVSSPFGEPATPYHFQPQATPLNNCIIRVTGSRIAPEYHAPLTRYISQMISSDIVLTLTDLDYDRWLIDMEHALDFNASSELLQYRTPYGGAVYIRNPIEWRCAISEMASAGKTILDFEIIRKLPGFTPVNRAMPRYDALPQPNWASSTEYENSKINKFL
jgi:hypothetical protein